MKTLLLCALVAPVVLAPLKQDVITSPDHGLPEIIWRAPRPATVRDWICGPAGCDEAPTPPFEFLREETTGTFPKVSVRDGRNRIWSVKFGAEVVPECFSSRFVTA